MTDEPKVSVKIEVSNGRNTSTFHLSDIIELNCTSRDDRIYISIVSKAARYEKMEDDMRIVTVYLKGDWATPGPHSGKDWDRGMVLVQTKDTISLQDNDYGLRARSYPMGNVARIEETGHW